MIREIIRPTSEYINIKVPKEYIDKDIEVLLFSSNEIKRAQEYDKSQKLLKEFERISKNISILEDKNIDLTKIDMDIYDDIL